ncbi:MAG: sugar lyase [Bacteroidales bacterium]|jgi:chondroitin AC lyase|nr:sugar lyase [Bacteroidales bacterium]MCI2122369.1 sugar lyase [Bacteroidales bacterium]MCI2146267.1 sugar lyase [Bacteroidales bacterium]
MKKMLASLVFAMAALIPAIASPLDEVRAAFVRVSAIDYAPDSSAKDGFISCSDSGRGNDVLMLQLYMSVHLPDEEVERLLGMLDANGEWSDIDYADKTRGRWQPTLHLTRLYALAKLYSDPGSKWYRNPRLHEALHSGIAYWLRTMPVCPNWWHNDIGVPKKMTAILLMIRDELSEDEISGGLKVLERSKFGRTGQNKVWLAGNNLMKGLLIDDEALVIKARDAIAEEIYVTDKEGIQADWSFHQHGPQMQFGNYGLAYVEDLAFWFRVLKGTPYMFTDEQYDIAARFISEGLCWCVWHGIMDPSFCGRQVFIRAGRGKAYALAVTAQNMAALKRPGYKSFENISKENLEPQKFGNSLCGARYFWRSDCGIFRARKWYASVRMHSERTIGFEMTNRENTLSNFSADGALLFMQHGGEYENIFAEWDWRRIPGVTAYDDGKPIKSSDLIPEKANHSKWVGGVCDDNTMCTVMELNRDSLHALKADFFFKDMVVALGCGIRTDDPECKSIFTTLDQTHLDGDVTVGLDSGKSMLFSQTTAVDTVFPKGNVSWIRHDDRIYVLLEKSSLHLSTSIQRGKWDPIDPCYKNKWEEGRIFKCYVSHDISRKDGSYAYAILPYGTTKEAGNLARSGRVRVLSNDSCCQAVKYNDEICAVFNKAGSLRFGSHLLKVDEPALIIINGAEVSVSSPLETAGKITVTLSERGNLFRLVFNMPTDEAHLGQTVIKPLPQGI